MAAEILKRIPVQFEKAKESGNLLFYDSTTQRHADPSGLNVCSLLFAALDHILTEFVGSTILGIQSLAVPDSCLPRTSAQA
jgi:hypothetical protein